MQAIQSTAPPRSQRKQVCNGCRTRKKRCDAVRPSCSNCQKWNLRCSYTPTASQRSAALADQLVNASTGVQVQEPPALWDLGLSTTFFPKRGFPSSQLSLNGSSTLFPALPSTDISRIPQLGGSSYNPFGVEGFPQLSMEQPVAETMLDNENYTLTPALIDRCTSRNVSAGDGSIPFVEASPGLPEQVLVLELTEIFFSRFSYYLPLLHKSTFLAKVQSQQLHDQAPELLYAVITIAAKTHPDYSVRALGNDWFHEALSLCEKAQRDPRPTLHNIQAACLLLFYAWSFGEYSTGWILLGNAWRQACYLGFNHMDAEHKRLPGFAPEPQSHFEVEERRRTVWMLFIMDRQMSIPCGWPHAIDDRQFMVNLPINDDVFQMEDPLDYIASQSITFQRDFNQLTSALFSQQSGPRMSQYIIMAYILIGQVADHARALNAAAATEKYQDECTRLDTELVKFKLNLPRSAFILSSASLDNLGKVVWLNILLNTITILLHHQPGSNPNFSYCVGAAQATVQLVKEAAHTSIDVLLNPFIAPALYLSSRVLAIEWHESKDIALRSEIDLFILVFERLTEVFPTLGQKLKTLILHDLGVDRETAQSMRNDGAFVNFTSLNLKDHFPEEFGCSG